MTWVVSLTQQTQESVRLMDLQYQLTGITNSLMLLTNNTAAIQEERDAAVQAYLAQNTDAEGAIDDQAFDYLNCAAFTADFDRRLAEVHAKEQALETEKTQIETEIKMLQTNVEDQEKMTNKIADNIFGYKRTN